MSHIKRRAAFVLAKDIHVLIGYTFMHNFDGKITKMARMSKKYLDESSQLVYDIRAMKRNLLHFCQIRKQMPAYMNIQLAVNDLLDKYDVLDQKKGLKTLRAVKRLVKRNSEDLGLSDNDQSLEMEIKQYILYNSLKL